MGLSKIYFCVLCFFMCVPFLLSQEVPIVNYSVNENGQVELEVASSADNYYLLQMRHDPADEFDLFTSLTMGQEGTTVISEPLSAYPIEHYKVLEYPISSPQDTDNDSFDDVMEYGEMPTRGAFNNASPIDDDDGILTIDLLTTFKEMSTANGIPWSSFLDGQEFLKFLIVDYATDSSRVYFINSETHLTHGSFANTVGINDWAPNVAKGEIVFYPSVLADNGTLGVYAFNFTFGDLKGFETTQRTHELLARNMPFLNNNLSYFVADDEESSFLGDDDYDDFLASRIPLLYETELYADIDYLALHQAEGYGFFRAMELTETPNSRDIVLYESIPNSLPRVGGIMTSFVQTPLSHVNLRAIQDNVPNAFIRDPLEIDSIAELLNSYIYYRVEQGEYFIREATLDEVNAWYEDIRPEGEQTPALNLDHTSILPLDDITFDMSDGFGAKCANIATMRTFGFPDGTIPDGFGVPFYFYQEFMEYNGFFEEIEEMLADEEFQNDLMTRIYRLATLRADIKDADMPQWMLDELEAMHESFPEGTSVRCRSSTNNEDLPGFSGAGLYDSKTQHPHEGHISKSIKQVYASMWNFRAFDERDFYRVNQFKASMGVLCHPNYQDEKANGVGVSIDPIYQTQNTFYLNTQVGEELITNPNAMSIPEELLLDRTPTTEDGYIVLRYSNLLDEDELIMTEQDLNDLRDYLITIHDEFAILYDAVGSEGFAMDIEYKITSEDQLIIKQARPWASYWATQEPIVSVNDVRLVNMSYYPNPVGDYLNISCDCMMDKLVITDLAGRHVLTQSINGSQSQVITSHLPKGMYVINGITEKGEVLFAKKMLKL